MGRLGLRPARKPGRPHHGAAHAGRARRAATQGPQGRGLRALALGLTALAVAARLWVFEPLLVASDSMEPAVAQGSTVLLFKPGPALGAVERGRLVVFEHPHDGGPTLKRVVALGGQSVAIADAVLVVDGIAIEEPGIDLSRIDATYFGPVQVPEGHVFVLGDNRGVSIDSRDFGTVPLSSVRATVLLPWNGARP